MLNNTIQLTEKKDYFVDIYLRVGFYNKSFKKSVFMKLNNSTTPYWFFD